MELAVKVHIKLGIWKENYFCVVQLSWKEDFVADTGLIQAIAMEDQWPVSGVRIVGGSEKTGIGESRGDRDERGTGYKLMKAATFSRIRRTNHTPWSPCAFPIVNINLWYATWMNATLYTLKYFTLVAKYFIFCCWRFQDNVRLCDFWQFSCFLKSSKIAILKQISLETKN